MKGGYIMADMPSFCVKNKDGGIDFKSPGKEFVAYIPEKYFERSIRNLLRLYSTNKPECCDWK